MTHQGIQQFVLPDVGEGLTEAEILTLAHARDQVGQPGHL